MPVQVCSASQFHSQIHSQFLYMVSKLQETDKALQLEWLCPSSLYSLLHIVHGEQTFGILDTVLNIYKQDFETFHSV